jgi:hypothetical protein
MPIWTVRRCWADLHQQLPEQVLIVAEPGGITGAADGFQPGVFAQGVDRRLAELHHLHRGRRVVAGGATAERLFFHLHLVEHRFPGRQLLHLRDGEERADFHDLILTARRGRWPGGGDVRRAGANYEGAITNTLTATPAICLLPGGRPHMCAPPTLTDDSIGALQDGLRNCHTELTSDFEVDYKLALGHPLKSLSRSAIEMRIAAMAAVETHPVVRTMSQRATRSEPVEDAETLAINVSGRRTEFR